MENIHKKQEDQMKNYVVSIVCPLQPEVPTNALQSVLAIRVWCFPRIYFLKTIYVLPTKIVALTARRRINFGSQVSGGGRERERERERGIFLSSSVFVLPVLLGLDRCHFDRIFSWSLVGKCEE
jgi:hypothetical protein